MTWHQVEPHDDIEPDTMVLRSQYAPTISPEEQRLDPSIYQTWREHCSLTSGGAPLPVVLAALTNVKYWVWAPPAPLTAEETARAKRVEIEGDLIAALETQIDDWVDHGDDIRLREEINSDIDDYLARVSA